MSKKQFIKRHFLIINKLQQKPCSFIEIQKHLKFNSQLDEDNYEISIRSFQRDLIEIQSIYKIEIKFNRNIGLYEIIDNQNEVINERLMDSFMIFDTMKMAQNNTNEIHFEQRKASGLENAFVLLHAIKNQFEISFSHTKYWDEIGSSKNTQPFALKEFKNRWYLIALDLKNNQIKTYGLDRISEIELSKIKFIAPSSGNISDLFLHSFGIIYDESAPQKVVLKVSNFQMNYLKAMPLHNSQKIISENENYTIIELFIHSTHDFKMEILSMGNEVIILEPIELKQEIKETLEQSLKNY